MSDPQSVDIALQPSFSQPLPTNGAPPPGYGAPSFPDPNQPASPALQQGYPPQQAAPQGGYPPQQPGYAPQGGYPPQQQPGFPPQGGYPPQGQPGYPPQGYPPQQQPGYPPQQQPGYPPQGYPPPQQPGYPPQQGQGPVAQTADRTQGPQGSNPWEPQGAVGDVPTSTNLTTNPQIQQNTTAEHFTLSVFLLGGVPIIYIVAYIIFGVNPFGLDSSTDGVIYWVPLIIAVVFTLIYISGCLINSAFRAMVSQTSDQKAIDYLHQLLKIPPVMTYHVRCGHIEVYYTHTRRGTHRHTRWVTTFVYDETVNFVWWKDLTAEQYSFEAKMKELDDYTNVGQSPRVKLYNNMAYDDITYNWTQARFGQLWQEHCWRDVTTYVTRTIEIPGWTNTITVSPDVRPWWFNPGVYFIFCALGLFGIWRYMYNGIVKYVHVPYTKMVSINPANVVPGASALRIEMVG